jgi:hypothetical protein
MAALFPRWSNSAMKAALLTLAVGAATAIAAPMIYARTPFLRGQYFPVDQPVEFDHRHHVRDDGIDCRYCHRGVERTAWAGLPSTDVCVGCHGQVWRDSLLLEPVRRSYFSGQPIAWNRVHRLPDFAYFDHSIHVSKGVGCVECHGAVDEMARVYQVAPLKMGWCIECHRDPAPHLRPRDQITSTRWAPRDDDREALGRELARANGVRSVTFCSACHR